MKSTVFAQGIIEADTLQRVSALGMHKLSSDETAVPEHHRQLRTNWKGVPVIVRTPDGVNSG